MMSKELYKKALIELGKRVDLAENPNYIIKLALEKAIGNETIDTNYIKHLGNLWGQTKMVDVGSYTILKQSLTELDELKKRDTAVKVDTDYLGTTSCPNCGKRGISGNYCSNCGQKLDWSDKDE